MRNTLLFLCFRCFLQINDITLLRVGIYEIQQSWYLQSFKYICVFCLSIFNFWNLEWLTRIFISSCFKMLLLGVSKVRNTYISYPLVDVSIRFSPLLDIVLKAFSDVDIHFVLFEFVVVLLWKTMTFYWIVWGPHNGGPMGITLLKWLER